MKPQQINQEVLLLTGTSFAGKELCSRNADSKEERNSFPHEKLEKACWDGLVGELLPELADGHPVKKESFICQIIPADHFLCISMGTYNDPVLSESSIDPYCFITYVNSN